MTSLYRRRIQGAALTLLLLTAEPALTHELDHHSHQDAIVASSEIEALIVAFRETGNDHLLDDAWRLAQAELNAQPKDPDTLILAATIAQSLHEFDDALVLIDQALPERPGLNQAWLLRASILLVRGQTEAAQEACRQLRDVHILVTVGCRARVAIARDENAAALKTMTAVIESLDGQAPDPGLFAWALSIAADAAAPTRPEVAIDFYAQSLALQESVQVRSALVDRLILADRFEDAQKIIADGYGALPLQVRRFIVAKQLGEIDGIAEEVARADHRFKHWIEAEDWAHAREMARFYFDVIDRPALAQKLATINVGLQKEAEDLLLARRAVE